MRVSIASDWVALCHQPPVAEVFLSAGDPVTIGLITDGTHAANGFQFSWQYVGDSACFDPVTLTDASGTIESEGYQDDGSGYYPNWATCRWIFQPAVQQLQSLQVTFLAFDVEDSTDCTFDVVEVYDGVNASAPLLLKACGSNVPAPITTTGGALHVRLRSNRRVSGNGFKLAWNSITQNIETVEPSEPESNAGMKTDEPSVNEKTTGEPPLPETTVAVANAVTMPTSAATSNKPAGTSSFCMHLRMAPTDTTGGSVVRETNVDRLTCFKQCQEAGPCRSFYFHRGNNTCILHETEAPAYLLQTRDGWSFWT